MHLLAFDMAAPGHIQQGLWTHARDRSRYASLEDWVALAKRLEEAGFDGLFLADVLGVYDVYEGGPDAALRGGVQVPLLDPALLVPAMAAATSRLGFAITASTAYELPYLFARKMTTLDHLTEGRIGWNIVTGYLDSAARAMGFAGQMRHDDRYDFADEYCDVLYALWEGGWAEDAVRRDRAGRIYTDPARVRRVRHAGKQFSVDAVFPCEPSPQRTPVLFQAGASARGRQFAARHAECVFLNGTTPAAVAETVRDLRTRTAPRPIKVFVGATVVVGRTAREAEEKLADYAAAVDTAAFLAHASASLGIDFARFELDEPVDGTGSNAVQSNLAGARAVLGPGWTKRRLVREAVLGSRQTPIVGDPAQVADTLEEWVRVAGVDGFNLSRTVHPEGMEDFCALVVPVLRERGLMRTEVSKSTLRERLFGAGRYLPERHAGHKFRYNAPSSQATRS